MYSVLKESDRTPYALVEFLIDSSDDITELPTEDIPVGSSCLAIEDCAVFILNNKREWVLLS